MEKLYDKSSIDVSCVSSYYKSLAFPLLYPLQLVKPEKIGASAYVFSFSPGETVDKKRIFSGGVPIDFKIFKDNPIFSDFEKDFDKMRWWGGPALIIPDNPNRDVKVLAKYPSKDLSENKSTKIYARRYTGGFFGLICALMRTSAFIWRNKDENTTNSQ